MICIITCQESIRFDALRSPSILVMTGYACRDKSEPPGVTLVWLASTKYRLT